MVIFFFCLVDGYFFIIDFSGFFCLYMFGERELAFVSSCNKMVCIWLFKNDRILLFRILEVCKFIVKAIVDLLFG